MNRIYGYGRVDITGRANSGIWRTSLSQGNGFATTSWKKWTTSGNWNDVVVGDFDGDGKDDIAGRRDSNKWWIGISRGNRYLTKFWGKWNIAQNWNDIVVGDFNADGNDDITGRNDAGQWINLISQGTSFLNEVGPLWNSALNWTAVFVGNYIGPITPASPPAGSQAGPTLVFEASASSNEQATDQGDSSKPKHNLPAASSAPASSDAVEELFGDSNLLDLLYQV